MIDYAQDYRTLGVEPGCSLQTLKGARRRLVMSWHPDRFPADSSERHRAEEWIKNINTAFDRLVDYHRNFGFLPTPAVSEPPPIAISNDPVPSAPQPSDASSDINDRSNTTRESTRGDGYHRTRSPIRWVTLLVAIVLLAEGLRIVIKHERHEDADTPDITELTQTTAEPTDTRPTKQPTAISSHEQFTIGSTLGEVYSTQGVPTSTENGVWHYGKSKVYFVDGTVISWEDDPDDPLKATLLQPVVKHDTQTFTLGSTKPEVRAAQGSPLIETETLWDYGLSKIHFRDNRVVGWESSPMRPLKARK